MSTTTDLSTLKINYLTQAQYDNALANDEINENELYMTPEPRFPIGTIEMYGGTTAPTGWLICDGSEYAIADYPALYAVIGGNFGSASDTDHFLLPDFRGRMPLGVGTGTASDATTHTLNQQNGTEGVTLDASQSGLRAHTHTLGTHYHTLSSHTHGVGGDSATHFMYRNSDSGTQTRSAVGTSGSAYTWRGTTAGGFNSSTNTGSPSNNMTSAPYQTTSSQGTPVTGGINGTPAATQAHNNMPPFIGINFIIYAGA